jgi:hypothetical protein
MIVGSLAAAVPVLRRLTARGRRWNDRDFGPLRTGAGQSRTLRVKHTPNRRHRGSRLGEKFLSRDARASTSFRRHFASGKLKSID